MLRRFATSRAALATGSAFAYGVSWRGKCESIAFEQAERLVNPSPSHPATGSPTADPNDPCVLWREHWDLSSRRPYYHHLVTNEVTWDLPPRFPSRFHLYYSQLVTENPQMAMKIGVKVAKEMGNTTSAEGTVVRPLTIKEQIKNYGLVGFLLYGGVDLASFARKLGFDVGDEKKQSITATFLLAIAVNKIFVPFQLGATLWLAPRAAPYMRRAYYMIMT